jgi:hypothetical protein
MEWLIKGRASILAYSPPNMNARYYILLKNDSLYELQNTSQIEEIKNIAYDHNNKEYIGALLYYLRDCPSISSNIETAAYNSKSLIKIAKKYHEKTCANEKCIVFEDKSRKLKYELGLSFGSLNSQLLLNNTIPEKVDLTRSMGYGIVINTSNLPLVSQKFSFRIQIMYFNSLYTYDTEGLYWSTDDRICRINYLRIPFQLKYKFSYKKLSPFVSLGFTANVRFDYKEYDKTLVSYVTEHFRYDLGMKPCQVGFNGGLGLEYSISPKVAINFGFEYEYTGSFFGTYIGEKSYSNNYLIQTSILYKMK